jgi:signal transduction histidine kinase
VAVDGTILYANEAGADLLGSWSCRKGEALPDLWRGIVLDALGSGCPKTTDVPCGSHVYALTFTPISHGKHVNVYGLDITERRRAEEATIQAQRALVEQQRHEKERVEAELAQAREELILTTRLAAIGQVSASIAHDLRNPLGAVRNASYLLKRRLPKETYLTDLVGIIDQEVTRADQIISHLLSLARAQVPHKQQIDLGRTIHEVFEKTAQGAEVRLVLALEPEPFWVHADPVGLIQVVSNLLANALEAMAGKGTLSVEATHGAGYDTLVFRDTGPGIQPEVRDKLFDPLVTTKVMGTGLGLTICRQIMERHGGTIQVSNTSDVGVAFVIRLPRA